MKPKAPQEILDRRTQGKEKKKITSPKKVGWDWKFWLGILLAIAGLILSAIALHLKPAVSLQPPLDPRDVLTTRFEISNAGLLALKQVEISLFKVKVTYSNHIELAREVGKDYSPPTETLEPDDTETVPFADLETVPYPIQYADIALIAIYRPIAMFFPEKREVFRFRTVRQADGFLRLERQPPGDVLEQYDEVVKVAGFAGR